jgi:hypothetical protein
MSTFTFSDRFLKIYINKNSSVFNNAGRDTYKNIEEGYAIMYNDYE